MTRWYDAFTGKPTGLHNPNRTTVPPTTCRHCQRRIEQDSDGLWVDPEATGDDSIWRETCDAHDTFMSEHEPEEEQHG